MIRLTFILAFLLFTFTCVAQTTPIIIEGIVTDAETKQPLPGISVYINNSTISTQTNKDGKFYLSDIPPQLNELMFSAVNYETQSVKLDVKNRQNGLQVTMLKKSKLLDEVVVKAVDKDGWAQYGSVFLKDFLSYSPFSKECTVLNQKAIKFRNNKQQNILKAYAKEPLKIRNEALGYDITYWLEEYEHQFSQRIVFFKGYTQFTEMHGNKRKQRLWLSNRNESYHGSLTHFLSTVYKGTTGKEGYIINRIKTIKYKDINLYVPAMNDTINSVPKLLSYGLKIKQSDSLNENANHFINRLKSWLNSEGFETPFYFHVGSDSSGYNIYYFLKNTFAKNNFLIYRFDVESLKDTAYIDWQHMGRIIPDERTINAIRNMGHITPIQKNIIDVQLFYTDTLNVEDFVSRRNGNTYFQFDDTWQITYTKEQKEKAYIDENFLNRERAGFQQSTLKMIITDPVIIFADGYYAGPYSFITGAYWSYEKIDKMLPLNFVPTLQGEK